METKVWRIDFSSEIAVRSSAVAERYNKFPLFSHLDWYCTSCLEEGSDKLCTCRYLDSLLALRLAEAQMGPITASMCRLH